MFEVQYQTADMVHCERAPLTLPLLSRFHHEVLDQQLTMLLEQILERHISMRRREEIIFFCLTTEATAPPWSAHPLRACTVSPSPSASIAASHTLPATRKGDVRHSLLVLPPFLRNRHPYLGIIVMFIAKDPPHER
jgi:hypothetical protein